MIMLPSHRILESSRLNLNNSQGCLKGPYQLLWASVCGLMLVFSVAASDLPRALVGLKRSQNLMTMKVKQGTLFFDNGDEVKLWGVNFQPCLSSEFKMMKKRGLYQPFDKRAYFEAIEASLDEIEILGADIIRFHISQADITDGQGRLVENLWLETLDYLCAATVERGIYLSLALLNDYGWSVKDSYARQYKKQHHLFLPEAQQASETYIRELLNRKNPYDQNRPYKKNPAWVIVEPMNEPMFFDRDQMRSNYPGIETRYQGWLAERRLKDQQDHFIQFRKQNTMAFIGRMQNIFKTETCSQVMSWSLNWPRFRVWTGDDPFQATLETDCDLFSFCLYPGQSETPKDYRKEALDLSQKSFDDYLKTVIEDPMYHGWMLEDRFKGKAARIVYEFESWSNQNSTLYPRMAQLFRSLGAQVATMWTYRMKDFAPLFSGTHNMNLLTTPRKAASFMIAKEIFYGLRRYSSFHLDPVVQLEHGQSTIEWAKDLSTFSNDTCLIHTGPLKDRNLILTERAQHIIGYGASPFVNYEGNGLYLLSSGLSEDGQLHLPTLFGHSAAILHFFPGASFNVPHYSRSNKNRDEIAVHLEREQAYSFAYSHVKDQRRAMSYFSASRPHDKKVKVKAGTLILR